MMRQRFSLAPEHMRQIDAACATLRRLEDRSKFRQDLISWLELHGHRQSISNDDINRAITATLGIVPLHATEFSKMKRRNGL